MNYVGGGGTRAAKHGYFEGREASSQSMTSEERNTDRSYKKGES